MEMIWKGSLTVRYKKEERKRWRSKPPYSESKRPVVKRSVFRGKCKRGVRALKWEPKKRRNHQGGGALRSRTTCPRTKGEGREETAQT